MLSALMLIAFYSCNSDSDTSYEEILSSSVRITSFSLQEDDDVLANLDSVFFTIDLDGYRIFNADSLPYGTETTKLIPSLSLGSASAVEFIISGAKLHNDTTYNYLANPSDTIDFSGNVVLRIVSADTKVERKYTVNINVHQVKPDSLYWNKLAYRTLPTTLSNPTAQKAVDYNGKALCMAGSNGMYTIGTTTDPSQNNWKISDVTFSFTPDISTLTASDALYMLDTEGNLYSSTDGMSWSATGIKMHTILGGYQGGILGIEQKADGYYHTAYPTSLVDNVKVADGFPIEGASPMVTFSSEWSDATQAFVIGGRTAAGTLSRTTWGFDGAQWMEINTTDLPAYEDMTLFPYFCYKTDESDWSVSKQTTWIAMGGRDEEGNVSKDVYVSFDCGWHWHLGDEVMQLPDYIPAFAEAQVLVFSETLTARSTSVWKEMQPREMPRWWVIENSELSRATKPIEEWECPYIYLFGGVDTQGNLHNSIWRGVINRLTFKPVI